MDVADWAGLLWAGLGLDWAALGGHVDAMRVLLNHSCADPAVMMMLKSNRGSTAFMYGAQDGHVNAMRVLLDHPLADPAAMMRHARRDGWNALMVAAQNGHVDAMRLLLDHPFANPATMTAARSTAGTSALVKAARFAAGQPTKPARVVTRSCAPLLLLLRRVAEASQPSDAYNAHMSQVVEALRQGPRFHEMFLFDQPDDARDECVRLLLAGGVTDLRGRVVVRIVH
ncbi:hypothetical protein FOA52_014714 [Chlamydomonas sp. UWO 241]|nr:hypothetical protein FOA52_014714 [Chlamydomonas sp. UWO 241]